MTCAVIACCGTRKYLARHRVSLAVLLLCLAAAVGRAADPADGPGRTRPRGEFAIGKDGRLILLPVTLRDRNLHCLLDTGASWSAIDTSLKEELGALCGTRLLKTPAGLKRVEVYNWPDAKLSGQSLKSDRPIACLDLADTRRGTNEEILGIIGMDVLGKCRLQIDFDRGILRFLESLPPAFELGEKIPIEFSRDGTPFIAGFVANERAERFLVDTGAQGNSFDADLFDQLLSQGTIKVGKSSISLTIAGKVQGDRGEISRLSLGPFVHNTLRFSRLNVNSLGIRYFSRFRVTFDFPGKAVYLQRGAHYTRPEPCATSGLTLNWIGGEAVVESVREQGPADVVGIRPGDLLVSVNDNDAVVHDPFMLRQLLTSEGGRKVAMTVNRGGRILGFELVLAAD